MSQINIVTLTAEDLRNMLTEAACKGAEMALIKSGSGSNNNYIDTTNLPEILQDKHVAALLGYEIVTIQQLRAQGFFDGRSGMNRISARNCVFDRDTFLAWIKTEDFKKKYNKRAQRAKKERSIK
jgi:hypothetical protein